MIGLSLFFVGMIGVAIGSKGQRGGDGWSRRQKTVCAVSSALVIVGLALADASRGHA